jgi:ankyrin repeat protein
MNFSSVYAYVWLILFISFWLIYFIASNVWHLLTNPITKIHQAVLDGNIDLVRECLHKGVEADYRQNGGISPLCLAAAENCREIAELLITYGADVNQGLYEEDGDNPLLSAAIGNHLESVQILLDYGAIKGLHVAALQGDINTARKLLERQNFQINSKRNGGMTPLHLATIGGHRDIVELLLNNNANIEFSTPASQTPLHQAVKFNRIKVVDLLIDRGADPNRALALHVATKQNYLDIVRLLISKGVDINYQNDGIDKAPLHEAAERGFLEIAEILLASSAKINIKFMKETPLHYGSKEGHLSMVKLLVYNGAKINIDDGFLGTPLDYAVSYKKKEIIDFLKQNGGIERSMNL